MKLIKPVHRIDIKRSFLMTPFMRKFGVAGKHAIKLPSRAEYLAALKKAKRAVLRLNETRLDQLIGNGSLTKRLRGYNKARWFLGKVSVNEVGVWKGAGGLPVAWTRGSLFQTAMKVKKALRQDSTAVRERAKRAIPAILQFKNVMQKEKYLLPIVFEAGFGTNGRKGLLKMKGDIDDGCMRAIALTIGGAKRLPAYIGLPKK